MTDAEFQVVSPLWPAIRQDFSEVVASSALLAVAFYFGANSERHGGGWVFWQATATMALIYAAKAGYRLVAAVGRYRAAKKTQGTRQPLQLLGDRPGDRRP